MKLNKQLPYLVGNVVEILDLEPDGEEEDGAAQDQNAQRRGKSVVVKTSTRQTIFLPVIGLVDGGALFSFLFWLELVFSSRPARATLPLN